jgi:AAA domain
MTDSMQGLAESQGLAGPAPDGESPSSGLQGFSQKVLRYFLTFLQTDFKKQQAPRRRIQTQSETGFRIGMQLRKYVSLYKAAWKFAGEAPNSGLTLRIAPAQYTAPISPTLRDLIRQHTAAIDAAAVDQIVKNVTEYATSRRSKAVEDPEKFVESVQTEFVEETGSRIVHPMLALLDGPFRAAAYSAIESVYDVESELTDALVGRVLESLPSAVNTLVVSGDTAPIKAVFEEFFRVDDVRARAHSFFDDFATADAFQEIRDLQHSLRSAENQSLYLYLCDIRFGAQAFPLFYIPVSLEYDEENKAFVLEFDPHLFVNKQAIDWILQERQGEATRLPLSPVADRVLYLDGRDSFLDEMVKVFSRLVPAFEIANEIDLRQGRLQQVSSSTLKISTAAWFSVFDRSDESLLNDYEELLEAFSEEQKGAGRLFANIIQGFLYDNPVSVTKSVDEAWEKLPIADRLVVDAPIPLNEEQRRILSALRDPKCNYVSVQGPPGTGKSHTITALAFEGILSGQTVLVLSDKTEALDVAQDKLESVLSKVRHGDDDFPNPILRLGRSGNTYSKLVSASAREKIKTHYQAARHHAQDLAREITKATETLRTDIGKTVETLSAIKLPQVEELHRLETEIEEACPGIAQRLQKPAAPGRLADLGAAATRFRPEAAAPILSRISKEPE